MIKLILGALIFVIYSIVIFLIGFAKGDIKAGHKNIEKELNATEQLLKAQGDSTETIKATLEMIRIDKLNKIGGVKREFLSIGLPSILVIINIFITVCLKYVK